MGLSSDYLGKTISEMKCEFSELHAKYDLNVCGEGGEYESAVFDCPLFKTHRIVAKDKQVVLHSLEPDANVCYLKYQGLQLEEKSAED